MKAKIIDGIKIAQKIKQEVLKEILEFKKKLKITPKIVSITVGDNPATKIYLNTQCKICKELGVDIEILNFKENISQKEIEKKISKLNNDEKVHAIILNLPLPQHLNKRKIQNLISPKKDVEGITSENLGKLFYAEEKFLVAPCTALAIMECLKETKINLKSKEVVIVGHSEIVGKPVLLMLLSSLLSSPTVTVCHIATKNLDFHTKKADVLIVAVGKPNLITENMVKKGVVIIDVGINYVNVKECGGKEIINEKSNETKVKLVGDVDFENVSKKASFITPVPGGVGPVTNSILMKNLVNLLKQQYGLPLDGYKIF